MTETLKNLGVLGGLAVNHPRLIEVAFPLKQASLDSVHEKNVRHGHISTLHIWPARRPLAACRAALIATLLPDPGNAAERKKLLEKLAGTVVEVVKKKKLPSGRVEEKKVEETVGGILHWGRESGPDLEWFRQKIREAYGGRAPKVLDPFAGGGAIPLEAMRLGCEVTAIDINPVAWFILKCTLEYPQKLAGQHRPLPQFALESPEFMEGFFKGTSKLTRKQLERNLQAVQANLFPPSDVNLAWHVRAWGLWVLQRAKADLECFYPVMDGKPTVAYLWARTVTCKNCRAIVPLLKTRWLCKKDNNRVLLTMETNADGTGVSFGVQTDVPVGRGNSAQRWEHDKRLGAGTMSRSGATCLCCGVITISEDMHHDACLRVSPELIHERLLEEIGKLRSLTAGASAAGARVHNLPERPRDIDDDGEFHFAVLGPRAASDFSRSSAAAKRFLEETTAADRPRVYRNAVVLAVPPRDGLEVAQNRIREYLGWEDVRTQLREQHVDDPLRLETVSTYSETARKGIPEAIQQAYSLVVTVSDKNEVQAFKITVESGKPLFEQIKADSRSRIQDTPISAEALLPDGPYNLWRAGETSRRVKDLVGAFAQFPHLPKMLNRKAILDTLTGGCVEGMFVLRLTRADRSVKTFWHEMPDDIALKDPSLEVILPEAATLTILSPRLLAPGVLPGLWQTSELTLREIREYFAGGHVVRLPREGYEEPVTIPQAEGEVIEAAVHASVKEGTLWLTSGPASVFTEDIPAGILTDAALLHAPPQPVSALEVVEQNLPDAWRNGTTTALAVSTALSKKVAKTLPWATVRGALDGALRARLLERTPDSGPWPCDYVGAEALTLQVPHEPEREYPHIPTPPPSCSCLP